jgi:PH (Pleckstrin Homology) domain-containing protein
MIDLRALEEQLKRAGCNFRFWGKAELRELQSILMPGETVAIGVNGHYAGGFAFLCVTDRRLLLIDHKPMYLSLEDIRFDMIAEVDYSYRLLDATMRVFTANKSFNFTSWSQHRLRDLTTYTQQRVMEIRQYYLGQQFQPDKQPEPVTVATPKFVPSFALQTSAATLQHAGRLSIGSAARRPMHNPYAQVPLTSRHWSRRRLWAPDN